MGLRVIDYRDTDLLRKLVDEGGHATTIELAEALAMDDLDGHRSVGIRFSWMQRFGMVKLDEKTRVWMITDAAERILEAQSRAAVQRTIKAIPEEAIVEVVADAMTRRRLGDPVLADMLRREAQFGMSAMRRMR
jgi:hypothetical protein